MPKKSKSKEKCEICNKDIDVSHDLDGKLVCDVCYKQRMYKDYKPKTKEIRETKCTCQACGNTWYYGKQDEKEAKTNKMHNASKALMCCSGCTPALLIPDKKNIDLNKCPKCNSSAIEKEIVIHTVEV